jgi:hypothetical protein
MFRPCDGPEIRTMRIQIGKKIMGFRNMQEKLEKYCDAKAN